MSARGQVEIARTPSRTSLRKKRERTVTEGRKPEFDHCMPHCSLRLLWCILAQKNKRVRRGGSNVQAPSASLSLLRPVSWLNLTAIPGNIVIGCVVKYASQPTTVRAYASLLFIDLKRTASHKGTSQIQKRSKSTKLSQFLANEQTTVYIALNITPERMNIRPDFLQYLGGIHNENGGFAKISSRSFRK